MCAKKCEFEMFKISDVNIEKRDLQSTVSLFVKYVIA